VETLGAGVFSSFQQTFPGSLQVVLIKHRV
jgi:hypothetical protein